MVGAVYLTMALTIQNTRDLIKPGNFHLKILIYGLPGVGKTEWLSTANEGNGLGIAAAETGEGKGLLTLAAKGIDFCEPSSYADFLALASGEVFKDKKVVALDSLTAMTKTFIKDYTLAMPRMKGNSPKRQAGVPELDDYGVMGELTRKVLSKFIGQPRDIIVTATERYKSPDPETGVGEALIGPDLPGDLFLGSTAMFDFVFRLRTRQVLRDPKDAKSRYAQRYFLTQPDGTGTVAKCRSSISGKPLLDKEELFDIETGAGSFPELKKKILDGYARLFETK